MDLGSLRNKIESLQPEMLGTLEALVSRESPSTVKAAADAYAEMIAARFTGMGAQTSLVQNQSNGAQVNVGFSSSQDGTKKIGLLLCHYDTVWPPGTIDRMPFRIEGDKAFGPGVYDMKASHAMVEYALRAIAELGLPLPRPIEVLFTSDEEIGSIIARILSIVVRALKVSHTARQTSTLQRMPRNRAMMGLPRSDRAAARMKSICPPTPEYWRVPNGSASPWANRAMNYSHAAVREHQVSFVRELLDRYAPDDDARQRILTNRFYDHLSGSLAGVLEYMASERLFEVADYGVVGDLLDVVPALTEAIQSKAGAKNP